jgi:hypothetical protein
MTIYRALALNHLVFHVDIRRRRDLRNDREPAPVAQMWPRAESRRTSFCGYCQIVLHRFDAFDLFCNSRCLC